MKSMVKLFKNKNGVYSGTLRVTLENDLNLESSFLIDPAMLSEGHLEATINGSLSEMLAAIEKGILFSKEEVQEMCRKDFSEIAGAKM